MIFIKNQNIEIEEDNLNYKITAKQNNSTPGIMKLYHLERYHTHRIVIKGKKFTSGNIKLYMEL